MIICENCGKKVNTSDNYCTKCGFNLNHETNDELLEIIKSDILDLEDLDLYIKDLDMESKEELKDLKDEAEEELNDIIDNISDMLEEANNIKNKYLEEKKDLIKKNK